MTSRSPNNGYGPFLVLGSVVLVVAALYVANKVLIPLALAILLAFILAPVAIWLQKHGLKRVIAVTLVVVVTFALLGAFFWAIAEQVSALGQEMADNSKRISAKMKDLQGEGHGFLSNILKVIHDVSKEMEQATRPDDGHAPTQPVPVIIQNAEPIGGLGWFPSVAAPLLELLVSAALVIMLVAFMLVRREDLRNRLFGLIGHGRVTVTTRALDEAAHRISRYLITLLAINASFGGAFALLLFLLGVPYALLWGFLTSVLRFIPYIGTWLSLLLPLTISVASPEESWTQPLLVASLFTTLELTTANVIEPLLFSHSTGISQVALLVAAAFWTWLWGPIGLVMSTPLTVCLVVLGKYVPQLAFFDVLLGDEPVLTPPVGFYQRLLAKDQDEASDVVEEQLRHGPLEGAYDRILLPALVLARFDQERGQLPPEDQAFIIQVIHDVLETITEPQLQIHKIAGEGIAKAQGIEPLRVRAKVFGCPARDEMDELALEMLRQLLKLSGCQFELSSSRMLAAEIVGRVAEANPALVCIASVGPGGLAQTRYLCMRLSGQFPNLKILVGRWGQDDNAERVRERLQGAGASCVATSLLELRDLVVPLLSATTGQIADKAQLVETI